LAWQFFPAGRYWSSEEIANQFLHWQAAHAGRPFFAFLNFLDVHEHHPPGHIPPEVPMRVPDIRGYDEATLYVDSVVQAVQDTLAARGLGDRTLLIVTADHGEQFREHGLTSHGNSLYMQLLRVPLLLRYPGKVPAGLRVGTLVSTRDLAATIADLTGIGKALPGVSLAETWRHPEAPREPALSEVERDASPQSTAPSAHGPMRALADSAWHYIQGPLGAEERPGSRPGARLIDLLPHETPELVGELVPRAEIGPRRQEDRGRELAERGHVGGRRRSERRPRA